MLQTDSGLVMRSYLTVIGLLAPPFFPFFPFFSSFFSKVVGSDRNSYFRGGFEFLPVDYHGP